MKRLMLVWVMMLCLVPLGAWAEAETIPEVHSGMSLEQVEAIWGSCAGSDSYNGNLRWYVKDGHTLICGFAWYNPSKDIWYNGQLSDEDIWGLTDWIEFDANRRHVGGNIAASDSVWHVMYEIAAWNEEEYNHMSPDEESRIRIHEIGSGYAIPAKITGDGWIVEWDILPVPIPCIGQSVAEIILPLILGIVLLLGCLILILARLIKTLRTKIREGQAHDTADVSAL